MITLTYTNNEEHPGFQRLVASLERWDHCWVNIGYKANQYDGHMCKLQQLHKYLSRDTSGVVLFVDGHDTIVNASQYDIMCGFEKFGHPFVMSAETFCAPYGDLHRPIYEAANAQISTSQRTGPLVYPYLNCGVFMGFGKELYELLDKLAVHRIPKRHNDQGLLSERYLRNPGGDILLDTNAELFQSLYNAVDHVEIVDGRIYNKVTKTTPLILHGNGGVNFDHLVAALLGDTSDRRS